MTLEAGIPIAQCGKLSKYFKFQVSPFEQRDI